MGGTFTKRKPLESAAKRSEERDVPKGEGVMGKAKEYSMKTFYLLQDHWVVVLLSLCLGIVPLLLFCCGSKRKSAAEDVLEVPASSSSTEPSAAVQEPQE